MLGSTRQEWQQQRAKSKKTVGLWSTDAQVPECAQHCKLRSPPVTGGTGAPADISGAVLRDPAVGTQSNPAWTPQP